MRWETRDSLLKRAGDKEDEQSWSEFVHYYQSYIYQLVRNMNLSHHDTQEIVQDVLVKVWGKLSEFTYQKKKGRFRGWLCVTTRNTAVDFLRRNKKLGGHCELYERDAVCKDAENSSEQAEQEWKLYLSNQAWENIRGEYTEKIAQAFTMISQGKSTVEISGTLSLTENSIYNAKFRIIKRLQKEIKRLDSLLDI